MSLTDAPAIITTLSTQLVACAAWTGGSGAVWYPEAPGTTSTTHAVLVPMSMQRTRYAEGANGILGGSLVILLYVVGTDTLGDAETLAGTLVDQLMAQHSGIPFRSASYELAGDPGAAKTVGGSTIIPIQISLEYGLSA
jgi:hypothetical protein